MKSEQTTEFAGQGGLMPSLLLTGQFWHHEFADLVNGLTVPTTVMRKEQLMNLRSWTMRFGLVLVCKERRGAITQELIDRVKSLVPETPVIALLGSWCEGESRSGSPLTGVTSIYWHQWQGEYCQLQQFVKKHQLTNSLFDLFPDGDQNAGCQHLFAISALTLVQYEMMAEAVAALGGSSIWLERSSWQAESTDAVTAVIVDSDSMTEDLSLRIQLAQSLVGSRPVICALGFPRKDEVAALRQRHGAIPVISKPFELNQLYHSIRQATGVELSRVPIAPEKPANAKPVATPQLDAGPASMPNQHQN